MIDFKMEINLALCCLLDQVEIKKENKNSKIYLEIYLLQGSADISTLTGKGKSSALNYRITEFMSAVQTRLDNSWS